MKKILKLEKNIIKLIIEENDPDKIKIQNLLSELFPQAHIFQTQTFKFRQTCLNDPRLNNAIRFINFNILFPPDHIYLNSTIAIVLLKEKLNIEDNINDYI